LGEVTLRDHFETAFCISLRRFRRWLLSGGHLRQNPLREEAGPWSRRRHILVRKCCAINTEAEKRFLSSGAEWAKISPPPL